MPQSSFLWLTALIALGSILPRTVLANVVGQPCAKLGAMEISDDHRDMLACLDNGSHVNIWKRISVDPALAPSDAPAPVADAQGKPVAHFASSGHLVWNARPPKTEPASSLASTPVKSSDEKTRWEGWYVGGNIGYAQTTDKTAFASSSGQTSSTFRGKPVIPNLPIYNNIYGNSAGLVAGYNWVTDRDLFYGGEIDLNLMNNSEDMRQLFDPYNFDGIPADAHFKSTWRGYSTMRGRVGLAFEPALVFLTGGLAFADIKDRFTAADSVGADQFLNEGLHIGWTAGAGAEFAVTNHIGISTQYLHLQMLGNYVKFSDTLNVCCGGGRGFQKYRLNDSADILRVGANWHFD